MELFMTPCLDAPDGFYEALVAARCGLQTAENHALNARPALVLAHHFGSLGVRRQALQVARGGAQ